jgi:hypothetical protein
LIQTRTIDPDPVRSPARRPVTIGVLLDGRSQEGWVRESLRQALAVPGTKLAAIAVVRGASRESFASSLHRILDGLDGQLRCRKEPLFSRTELPAGFDAPIVEVDVTLERDGWYPDEAGMTALRRCDVDVWLCFAAIPPRRPFGPVSRFGIWGIEIGQDVPAASPWAGAVEVSSGSAVTMVSVVDYAESRPGIPYQTFSATIKNSARRNRLYCLRKGMSFFRRLLEGLVRDRSWQSSRPATLPAPASYPELREPTVAELARLSWRLVSSVAANQLHRRRWLDQWQIGYYFADGDELGCRLDRLRYLVPPMDRVWADPFAVEHGGRYFVFCEEQGVGSPKAHIAAIEVFEDGEPGEAQIALERPYHLSYPFVFEWQGSLYMLPESGENGTVEIYRCEAFPLRWRLHRVLLENVSAYDATLWRGGDRWWMFVNMAEPGADSSDELHVYWSATPFGPWTAHRRNPVLSDVRCARPAGPLFSCGGKLYRPSQDCSVIYGHSVSINRVDVLREDEYRETAVERIVPGWRPDISRVHTFGRSKRLRVIDCMVGRKLR